MESYLNICVYRTEFLVINRIKYLKYLSVTATMGATEKYSLKG
jgi:hypothetical protein